MRNRAKCKKCDAVIESLYTGELVSCYCGEIEVYDGPQDNPNDLKSRAYDYANFIRIDDDNKEHEVRFEEGGKLKTVDRSGKPSAQEIMDVLKSRIDHYDHLPSQVQYSHVVYSDLIDILRCLVALHRLSFEEKKSAETPSSEQQS